MMPAFADSTTFPELLRTWRQKRRLSQLALALASGVSQRHLSFLESGRAKPSRVMILQLSEALDNLYRRPEEHNSFEQNADALAVHGGVGLRHVYA